MTMTRSLAYCAAFLLFSICIGAFPAAGADEKSLQNMHGSVSSQTPPSAAQPLAPNATTVLNDRDYAITGSDSLAAIGLPDSSRVLVGSQSKVQLVSFDTVANTSAKFVVVGKVRFIVQHPAGAKADYTFQTTTGSIAVRGTEGDIEQNGNDLRVNVYEVCDPNAPVTVTTSNGRQFKLLAGQSLLAQFVNGVLQAKVQQITQQLIDQFSPDFGVPTSWDAAKGEIVSAAQSQASNAIGNAAGGYGGEIAGAVGGLFGHKKATPTPSPTPSSTTCSH
ncbi:MAG TPA: FecR family protein [Candidatus Acidoferrales bacterium]|nr:FecR family protein [Candidatus Acidoferrales bacterium]